MASPLPEKLQPLNNFLQTHLKWKNHRSNRSKLAGEASSSSPPPWLQSPALKSHTQRHTSPLNVSCWRSPPHKQSTGRDSEVEDDRNYVGSQFVNRTTESSTEIDDYSNKRKRSNEICIRFEANHTSTPMEDSVTPKSADDESSPKTWNLRPRRPPVNLKRSAGGFPVIGTSRLQENKTSGDITTNKQSSEPYIDYNTNTTTIKLPKISISLSRGEIEADILLLTGSKPSRRLKKRPRATQKQLDNLFPGLWLDSITVDSYKVPETTSKKLEGQENKDSKRTRLD